MNWLDAALGIHPAALEIRGRRAELLAGNLANSDTPGYKARDIDFRAALEQAAGTGPLRRTDASHLEPSGALALQTRYRTTIQSSVDGNSVDDQAEKSAFMQNALAYQASLRFLEGRVRSLIGAIRGE